MKTSLPQTYNHPLTDSLSYPMVLVEPGIFRMGSEGEDVYSWEKPEHLVRITQAYYIGIYPVTQDIWEHIMGNNPSFFIGARRPVEQVSWLDIVEGNQDENNQPAFLEQFNQKYPAMNGEQFHLPTEAEWEYAAKGGHLKALKEEDFDSKASALYPLYAGSNQLKEVGWYDANSHSETKEVGLKEPNELGLYDMSGNVFEWCLDRYSDSYYQDCLQDGVAENPTGPVEGSRRVIRGGSWNYGPQHCRSTYRNSGDPEFRYGHVGFRLVLPQ